MVNTHYWTASSYHLTALKYSLSFTERMRADLGLSHYQLGAPTKEILALSDAEIIAKINALKAPWWDDIYERIRKNKRHLMVLYILLNLRDYGFQAPRFLYRVIRSKEIH